jgi:23S rRNA pseudouridine1911/1915/1917 synthase
MPDNGSSSEEIIIKPNKGRNPRKPRNKSENGDRSSQREARPPRFSRELSVLYEDDAVVALNKPPGLLSVPIKGSKTPSALSLVIDYLKPRRERAHIVHRIDRFVSGILLFAKTSADRDDLVEQFLEHTPVRQYLALVRGHLDEHAGTLVHYFRREAMFQELRSKRDPKADRAELHYRVEREFADASLVRVELVTGLQNQIRAQFAAIGHPVIGDRKYSPKESLETLISRVALHSAHLEFVHPRTGEETSIECQPPADFQYLVRELGKRR